MISYLGLFFWHIPNSIYLLNTLPSLSLYYYYYTLTKFCILKNTIASLFGSVPVSRPIDDASVIIFRTLPYIFVKEFEDLS